MPSLTRTAPPSGWLNMVRRVPLADQKHQRLAFLDLGAGLEDHLHRQLLGGKPLRRQHAVAVDRVIAPRSWLSSTRPALGIVMLTCGLAGEAGCPQSGAQVPNRPNCWNNASTAAALAVGGRGGRSRKHHDRHNSHDRRRSTTRNCRESNNSSARAQRQSARRDSPRRVNPCDMFIAGTSASPPSPRRRTS